MRGKDHTDKARAAFALFFWHNSLRDLSYKPQAMAAQARQTEGDYF